MSDFQEVYFQIRSNAIITYNQPRPARHKKFDFNNIGKKGYSGTVTLHSQKRLMSALDLLVQRSPKRKIYNPVSQSMHDFKMNFITLTIAHSRNLTFSEAHTTLLKPFLRYFRSKMGVKDYVWKAELQQRGQVHYHFATSTFIHFATIRWKWNQVMYRAGLLTEYAKKYKNYNPPSTDISSMESVDDCLSYIAKEMCKDDQNQQKQKGKIWDCNEDLKRKRYGDLLDYDMEGMIEDAIQHGFAERIDTDHCQIIKTLNPIAFLSESQKKDYYNHIN